MFVFLLLQEKKKAKKMITEIYEFCFFWSKNGRFVTQNCFSKKGPETPIFIECQKREILKSHPKIKKKLTDN